jgi:hypothetical protein
MTASILTNITQNYSTTTIISTTSKLLTPIFTCDFSINSCFEDSKLIITNGSQFNSDDIVEPPRAPLSDVSSIRKYLSLFHPKLIDI